MWKDLTLEQKAEIMKMSVANGVTDINDIQQLYDGSIRHKFDKGGSKNKKQTPKYQYGIIEQILRENGVNFRVTSGFRHPNEAGNAGKSSAHTYALASGSPAAIDIVPGIGSDWNTLYKQMNSPEVRAALASYGLDILDETNPVTMAKTKATGKHFHVGRGIKNQPGRGTFIGSTNPTIAAFNRVYGNRSMSVPDIDYEALYEPSRVYGLDWSNRPQQEEEQIIQRPTEPIMSVMEREEAQQEQPAAEQDNFVQLPSFRLSSLQSQPIAAQQRHALVTPVMQAAAQEAPSEVQSILSSPYIIFGRDLG